MAVNVAVQLFAAFMVTEPSAQSLSPLQLEKVYPDAGVALRVTTVALEKLLVQVEPQLIPDGLLVTVPVPITATVWL